MSKIKINTIVKSDINKVWNCYNQAYHITQWNFAINEWHCPSAEIDFNPGGKYVARMEAKDGSFGFDFSATYDEIIPFEKIAYTLDDGRKVFTLFENTSEGISITTEFDAETMNPIDMQKAGWQAILNNFKRYVENID